MTHYIITENNLPLPPEKPLPKSYRHQAYPSLAQFAALKAEEGIEIAEYLPPVYDSQTHALGVYVPQGEAWTREVVPRPAEEIAAELKQQRARNILAISEAARDYLFAQLDSDGLLLVDRLVKAGSAKALACEAWWRQIRTEQYRRMAVVEAGVEDFAAEMLDFSVYGDKPFMVPELLAELPDLA
ncbi:hypothetical protein [Desulfuromonas sp. TF]|uniref:hypothetical protein n=1 Tax=Desulfuromonas sp. TF TaxID=1232410 RepID=UPI000408760A|nr:hypothetical protein [Desulfuromonas sp. TF]